MKNTFSNKKLAFITLALFALTGCEEGKDDLEKVQNTITNEDKTFTISASSIVIKRISNDEDISVDITGIKSESMTLKNGS